MFFRSILVGLTLAAFATVAAAGPSGQHSDQAAYHSGAAASHGSAAVASGAATVVAVPVIAVGSTLAVTGSALQEIGTSAIDAGMDMSAAVESSRPETGCYAEGFHQRTTKSPVIPCVHPGPVPLLD